MAKVLEDDGLKDGYDDDADQTVVMAEHNVDLERGAADEQVALAVYCAMATALRFFEYLTTEIFPEEWKVFEAEQAEGEALGE
ncbi:YbjN domain-containing protein [Actinomyces faecalis]|uniref:YbjN domain-containing protein n=1 Tax=Actinomyces faecalis TaxID=2722820 RepID=UPI0015546D4F|nr:YbjN domain-containing protein [Actinomyces faecalis]